MECAVPWQRFEPSKCVLGLRQQNKRYPTAEYISVSYKDSMVEMPSFQIVSPWLTKPNSCTSSEIIEIGWCVSEHPFFQKLKMLHDHMKNSLLNNHKIKLNSNPYLLSIYLDKTKTVVRDLTKNEEIFEFNPKKNETNLLIKNNDNHPIDFLKYDSTRGVERFR